MRRTIDEMALLLKKHNITVPSSARKADHREETEEHEETCHALKARCSTTHAKALDILILNLSNIKRNQISLGINIF